MEHGAWSMGKTVDRSVGGALIVVDQKLISFPPDHSPSGIAGQSIAAQFTRAQAIWYCRTKVVSECG